MFSLNERPRSVKKKMWRFLLIVLHVVLSIVGKVHDAIDSLQRKYHYFLYNYVLDKRTLWRDFRQVRKLDKIPVHLTMLLGQEKPSLKDLSNVVLWSLLSGISFISFYDSQGMNA